MTELKALQERLAETDLVGFAIATEHTPSPAASKVGATKPPPATRQLGTAGAKMGATKDGPMKRTAAKMGATKVGATKPTSF